METKDVEGLAEAIGDLKARLQQDIRNRVSAFERRTGLTPSAIEVNMIDATSTGDPIGRFIVGTVNVDLGSF